MKVLFQIPSLSTVYAGRTIYYGYKNAFEDLGHTFRPVTSSDNFIQKITSYKPDLLITSLNQYNLKFMDLNTIEKQKKKGMKVFVNTPFWYSPLSKSRINETHSLSENKKFVSLIQSRNFGDIYYNVCEQGDRRMEGFQKVTGYQYHTILLAADKSILFPEYDERFASDVSFIGTYLPGKAKFFQTYVYPLKKKYSLKLYGQDWTVFDRSLGVAQRIGQYFNIPGMRSVRKPKLRLEDERRIYASSIVSLNIHEDYQRRYGGDCNERTFKIPLSGGLEITDDVACIKKYFIEGKEIIIARDKKEWFEKISYYITHPEKREPIIKAGRQKVLTNHTYHNRVKQMIAIYRTIQ